MSFNLERTAHEDRVYHLEGVIEDALREEENDYGDRGRAIHELAELLAQLPRPE